MTDRRERGMRRGVALTLAALVMAAASACGGVSVSDDDNSDDASGLPSAASKQDDTEIWDLRERPTAEEVGIEDGDDTAVYETRPSRSVRLRLPGGESLELSTRYVAFGAIGSADGKPVSVDIKTATMPLDETVATFKSVLKQLGLPDAEAATFEKAAEQATGHSWVDATRVEGAFGDVDLGVIARYNPHSERGVVTLGGGWLRAES